MLLKSKLTLHIIDLGYDVWFGNNRGNVYTKHSTLDPIKDAEEYWNYPEQYRKNIQALHFDERSYTLHTLSTWSTNKDYRYAIQPSLKYAQLLTHDWVKKVYYMIPRRKLEGPEDIDFMEFDTDVEDVAKRRKKKK